MLRNWQENAKKYKTSKLETTKSKYKTERKDRREFFNTILALLKINIISLKKR